MNLVVTLSPREVPSEVSDSAEWLNANLIPEHILRYKRGEVIKAYAEATGMSEHEIESEYEGGINDWIGFGSVTCYELPCTTLVGYQEDTLVLTLVK